MSAHLLSVVMPTHNRPESLERAARSVLSQQLAEIELVIVDDGSSDDTPRVTERLEADPRVRVVRNPESLGPGGSRNKGIALARGDFLGFCDDDDAWLPGAARCPVGLPRGQSGPRRGDIVAPGHSRSRPGGRPTIGGRPDLEPMSCSGSTSSLCRSGSFDDPSYPAGLTFDQSLPPCEDWDLWLRCAQLRPIEVVPLVLYSYYQHGGDRVTKVRVGIPRRQTGLSGQTRLVDDGRVQDLSSSGHRRARLKVVTPCCNVLIGASSKMSGRSLCSRFGTGHQLRSQRHRRSATRPRVHRAPLAPVAQAPDLGIRRSTVGRDP